MKIKISNIIILASVAGLFHSCKITETYEKPILDPKYSDKLYREVTNTDTISTANVSWRNVFTDPQLQTIISKTIENNLDLKIAVTNISETEAMFKQSKLQNLPTLDATASVRDTKNSPAAQGTTFRMPDIMNYQLGLATSWEIDIWGRIASIKRSAYAGYLQTDAAKRAVQTQLIAQTANLYYQLLALDKQLEVTKQTVALRTKSLESVKLLMEAAYLTGADIEQAKANLYAAELMIPDLELQIQQTENALSTLMNQPSQAIERGGIDNQSIYSDLKTGVPATILQNRPDVLTAELAFRQAFENQNIAKAQMYPAINLSAAIGFSTREFKNIFNNSLFYNMGGNLAQSIFQSGNRKTQLKTAEIRKERAYLNFEKALLTAGSEVSNALVSYQKATEKDSTRQQQIKALQNAVDYSNELLVYSDKTNYVNVLTAEQALLQAQLSAVNDKLQQLQAVTNFYRAVGGGQY